MPYLFHVFLFLFLFVLIKMDLTALELGLRNRQLLQVKCFLKIQVETFRYFLGEDLLRIESEERVNLLDKFFYHDWQNVINKIVSVAVVNMSGDYSSMMLAISLFRSIIQSCNQLLLIVKALDETEFESLFARTLPNESPGVYRSYSLDSTQSESTTIKNRLLNILQKQINSITNHLERIYNFNVGEFGSSIQNYQRTNSKESRPESCSSFFNKFPFIDDNKINTNKLTNLMTNDRIDKKQFSQLVHGLIPALHLVNRSNSLEDIQNSIIDSLVQVIFTCDITKQFAERSIILLAQTGRSVEIIFFKIFLNAQSSSLRQKILLILLFNFETIENIENMFKTFYMDNKNISFSICIQLCSIVDLFVYCFASNEDEMKISLNSLLQASQESWAKCFVMPVLEEISNTSESLIQDWRQIKEQFFDINWNIIYEHYLQLDDFSTLVTANILWEYWIDNNEDEKLIKWITDGSIDLIFCDQVNFTKDFHICQKMIIYLEKNGSFHMKSLIYEKILQNRSFLSGFSLHKLLPENFNFQRILSIIGKGKMFTEKLQNQYDIHDLFDKNQNEQSISLKKLIVHCLQNGFYDYLFLLFKKYSENSCLFQRVLLNDKLSEENQNILLFLIEMNSSLKDSNKNCRSILDQSIIVHRFVTKYDRTNDKESMLEILLDGSIEPELLLMIMSLSDTLKYENLKKIFYESATKFQNIFQRYPLISKVFHNPPSKEYDENDSLSIASNTSRTRSKSNSSSQLQQNITFQQNQSSDIYLLLQQAITQVDVLKFFKSQIKKRKIISKANVKDLKDDKNCFDLLNFSQNQLSETYGLKADLTSSYYLKNGRVVEAFSKSMKNNKCYYNQDYINDKIAVKMCRKAASIVYSSLRDDKIVTSCLMFQQLVRYFVQNKKKLSNKSSSTRLNDIDIELEKTRLHILIGKLIVEHSESITLQEILLDLKRSHFNNRKLSSQKLLSFAVDSIEKKYKNLNNLNDYTKYHRLFSENQLYQTKYLNDNDIIELFEAFEYKYIFEYSNMFKLSKPMNFLRKCANHDNWFLFSIFAQIYSISKDQIQELLRENIFNNSCIAEHLMKAFQNSSRLTSADSRFSKMKQSVQTSRNDFYSKIFKEKLSPNMPPGIKDSCNDVGDVLATSSSPETFSIGSISVMSKTVDDKNSETLVLYEDLLKPENANKDFFQLILEIYQNCCYFASRTSYNGFCFESTFRNTLLFASVSLSNPTLALLSCSLHRLNQTPVIDIKIHTDSRSSSLEHNTSFELSNSDSNFRFNAFMCWLISSANADIKEALFNGIKVDSKVYLKWSQSKSLRLIDLLSKNDHKIFSKLIQGFNLFNIEMPIFEKLLNFLILFFDEKEYYQKDDLLLEFKHLLEDYNEDDILNSDIDYENIDYSFNIEADCKGVHKIFYTKYWIEKCSLILITNSLLLAKQFELSILLSHYNFVRIQDSFSLLNHSVPDIQNLYFFSQCLIRLPDYNLPIRELLYDIQNVDYYQVFKSLIFQLQEENHFEEARNIVNLLPKTKTNEFLINEWMLKAKKSNHFTESSFITNDELFLDCVDLSFWENCWIQVTNLDPTMHSAYRVMERFAEHLETRKIHIKCFLYIKCLRAIETMLSSGEFDQTLVDSIENSLESLQETSFDLIHEYYQMEIQLWQSLVECEYLISKQLKIISKHKTDVEDKNKDKISFNDVDSLEENIDNVWTNIWKDLINFIQNSKLKSQIIPSLSTNYYFNHDLTNNRKKCFVLEDSKQDAIRNIIQKLLDSLCLDKAIEVGELFSFIHEDFEIIKSCEDIAKGNVLDVLDLPISVQFLLQKMNRNKNEFSSFLPEYLSSEQRKAIVLIEKVSGLITIGEKACSFILLFYKISCVLQWNYVELFEKRLTHLEVFKMLISSYGSETPRAFYDKTDLNNSFDTRRNYDREEFDQVSLGGDSGTKISVTNQYNEAIVCAKELIKLVGQQDEQLKEDMVVAKHLAEYTHTNILTIIEEQFKEFEFFQNQTGSKSEIEIDKSLIAFNNARFLIMIKLLKEPSILGYLLLDICKKQTFTKPITDSETEALQRKNLIVLTELFIRAHDCFSAQCDVQGISVLLRRIRVLIVQKLQPFNYYQLILRLLTGIGRYSEMNYCFEIFHDKFEMILSKRVTRTPQLRIALLNYLKTTDKIDELLPLVAVRFFLFRETAEYHRSRAEKMLIDLNNQYDCTINSANTTFQSSSSFGKFSLSGGYKRLSMTSLNDVSHSPMSSGGNGNLNIHFIHSITEQLKRIMNEFQEAEMNFTKASSHNSADYCSRKAQLAALQISYLNHAKKQEMISSNNPSLITGAQIQFILNLDSAQVRDFVNRCMSFHEALIVSRGYADVKIDWSDPFFSVVIINSNQTYAFHYSQTFPISLSLLDGIMKRYDQIASTLRQSKHLSMSRKNSITNSPSSATLMYFMNQIPNENEFQRIRKNIENLFEKIFFIQNNETTTTAASSAEKGGLKIEEFTIDDKYRVLSRIDSKKLLQKFIEMDVENNAFIADLRRLKML